MLPKQNKLKKRSAFTATYKTGKSFHRDGITVFCGRSKADNTPIKIGFVVSKKIHKRAVKRNRIKRLMRESIRLILKNEQIDPKYISLVFTASSKLLNKNFSEINTAMQKIIKLL